MLFAVVVAGEELLLLRVKQPHHVTLGHRTRTIRTLASKLQHFSYLMLHGFIQRDESVGCTAVINKRSDIPIVTLRRVR